MPKRGLCWIDGGASTTTIGGSAFPERGLTFRGRVTAVRGDEVALEVWEEDDTGPVLTPATARVRLPRRL